jgi:hypothetical protein
MGRALAGFIIGVLVVLAAIGFAMHYGLLPSGIRILQIGDSSSGSSSSSAASGSSGSAASGSLYTNTSMYTSNSSASGVVGAAVSYVFGRLAQYVVGSKQLVAAFFTWLLGSSLYDAILNLVVVVVVAGVLYWVLRFFKWIVMVVVAIDALLIVLKYVLMVI